MNRPSVSRLQGQQLAADWNAKYRAGQAVCYRQDDGMGLITRTRDFAVILGNHTAAILLEHKTGVVALDRVFPVTVPVAAIGEYDIKERALLAAREYVRSTAAGSHDDVEVERAKRVLAGIDAVLVPVMLAEAKTPPGFRTCFCSFCGKSQHEVIMMIAGPCTVCICDECAELCVDIARAETSASSAPPRETFEECAS